MDETAGRAIIRQTAPTLLGLTQAATASGAHVLLATVIPAARPELWRLPVWKESLRAAVAEVNDDLRRSTLPHKARLIDLSAALSGADDRLLPDEYRLDTLHLNQAGYDRLTVTLLDNLQHLRFAERAKR